ncbi:hypothetical protein B0I37DRAFT_193408 [Chaetomium sp. MPI-CAGE-AT-0009]|nr:hypothetical protein B0I37DRAFT_193408 [Chaetomium sp. MPI-CAGE-AT-0009]
MSLSTPEVDPERAAKRAAMNQEILETLQTKLSRNPSLNLDHEIPCLQIEFKNKYFPHPTASLLQQRRKPTKPKLQGFPAALLSSATKPVILNPLSDAAKVLIFGTTEADGVSYDENNLDRGVRRRLENGAVIAKLPGRGGILRCRDTSGLDIVVKIVPASTNSPETEFSALKYPAEHASDFSAPKPHGLLRFGNSKFMMMSYIPSTTLRDVWPSLSHQNKLSIKWQLGQLFKQLREIKQQPGGRLGGVGGEGVCDRHAWVEHIDSETIMTTPSEFRDFRFSIEATCGVEDPMQSEEYVVTGIIDWEESGFYPPWFESSKGLYTFGEGLGNDNLQDWWKYVPDCIAPASYPLEWAVGRLWGKANGINV